MKAGSIKAFSAMNSQIREIKMPGHKTDPAVLLHTAQEAFCLSLCRPCFEMPSATGTSQQPKLLALLQCKMQACSHAELRTVHACSRASARMHQPPCALKPNRAFNANPARLIQTKQMATLGHNYPVRRREDGPCMQPCSIQQASLKTAQVPFGEVNSKASLGHR